MTETTTNAPSATVKQVDPLMLAVSGIAARFMPETDLAPLDESETADDYAVRLLNQMAHDLTPTPREEELQKEVDRLLADLDAAHSERDKLAKRVNTKEGKPSGRKCGPIKGGNPDPADLADMIGDADSVELVFSNGRSELPGIAPRTISGPAFALGVNGLMLRLPGLHVHGPGIGQSAYQLDGYGLFLDGKQVAYAARGTPLNIGGGQTVDLSNDVIFAG